MNPKRILQMLGELAMLKYFPANNEAVLIGLARLVNEMCASEDQVRWLVDRMTSGLYSEWPGPAEMRACFCSRFNPRDGINAYSQVYPDGLPPSKDSRALSAPAMLALPEGHAVSADPEAERMIRAASDADKSKAAIFNRPITKAEIRSAPEWLRRIDGYE